MIKVLLSPLFLALMGLIAGQFLFYLQWRQIDHWRRRALVLLSLVTITLLIPSTPVVATQLAQGLEGPYYAARDSSSAHVDVVVVLSAGYAHGPVPEMDVLTGTTYARVVRGVQVVKRTKARIMIVSGRSLGGDPGRLTDLMKALAVALGVPSERVRTEPRATNTFMHPIEVAKLREVKGSDILGIVTSAWHLPRAMAEFQRHFARVVAFPADFDTPFLPSDISSWFPQVSALECSTKLLHERIGIAWYALRNWAPAHLGRTLGEEFYRASRIPNLFSGATVSAIPTSVDRKPSQLELSGMGGGKVLSFLPETSTSINLRDGLLPSSTELV